MVSNAVAGDGQIDLSMRIPYMLWMGDFAEQEIIEVATSPDGKYVAAACTSGQVYIWSCDMTDASRPLCRGDARDLGDVRGSWKRDPRPAAGCGALRLDPLAVALEGWLGATEVSALAFCNIPIAAEIAGLASGVLLVCLMSRGHCRLLDPETGRCVSVAVPQCGQSLPTIFRVLSDGRHAAFPCLDEDESRVAILDLWTGATVGSLALPESQPLLLLAAPEWQHQGEQPIVLPIAGATASKVVSGSWSSKKQQTRGADTAEFDVLYRLSEKEMVVGMAMKDTLLIVALPSRVLVWRRAPFEASQQRESLGPLRSVEVEWGGLDGTFGDCPLKGLGAVSGRGSQLPAATATAANATARASAYADRRLAACKLASRTEMRARNSRGHRRSISNSALPGSEVEGREEEKGATATATAASTATATTATKVECRRQRRSCSSIVQVLAWTEDGRIFSGCFSQESSGSRSGSSNLGTDDDGATTTLGQEFGDSIGMSSLGGGDDGIFFFKSWGRGPASCCLENSSWLMVGNDEDEVVGLRVGSLGDGLLVSKSVSESAAEGGVQPAGWYRAADLASIWNSRLQTWQVQAVTLVCAGEASWLVMARSDSQGFAVFAGNIDQQEAVNIEVKQKFKLPLPEDFGRVECLCPVSCGRVVAGGEKGDVCWWTIQAGLWTLGGKASRRFNACIYSVCNVWCPGSDGGLFLDASTIVALDAMGCGRLIDLECGEVLCSFQSQSGPSLWVDEPIRVTFDKVRSYLVVATPRHASVWEASSGDFEGMHLLEANAAQQDSVNESRGAAADIESLLCGIEAVPWQPIGCGDSSRRTSMGADIMLDGPFWRRPVLLKFPIPSMVKGGPSELSMEAIEHCFCSLLAEERPGRGQKESCSAILAGILGSDSSCSFPAPRRQGLRMRSASPHYHRQSEEAEEEEEAYLHSPSASSRGTNTKATAATTVAPTTPDTVHIADFLPAPDSSARVGFVILAKLLLSVDPGHSQQLLLQRTILPEMQKLLAAASLKETLHTLTAWSRCLQSRTDPGQPGPPPPNIPLRQGGCQSLSHLRGVAMLILAMVSRVQPSLLDRVGGPALWTSIGDALRSRMLGRAVGPTRMQGAALELFADGFNEWRRAMTPVASSSSASTSGPTSQQQQERQQQQQQLPPQQLRQPHQQERQQMQQMQKQQSPRAPAVDEEIEWLAARVLSVYQEPALSQPALTVLIRLGNMEPLALVNVMASSARRQDLGAQRASSALLVLVAFVRAAPGKVVPILVELLEATLRCLDPNDPGLRRQTLLAVTTTLHEMVKVLPMAAFHQQSQKFVIGSRAGFVLVYDLRTASKWRVLEGHLGPVDAVAFSPDGDRLCSYSAQDRSVRVWQCGSQGFLGLDLGSLMGSGGRCLKQHELTALPQSEEPSPCQGHLRGWRDISIAWTEPNRITLTRENSKVVTLSTG